MKKKIKKQLVKIFEILADIRCRMDVKQKGFHVHEVRDAKKKQLK